MVSVRPTGVPAYFALSLAIFQADRVQGLSEGSKVLREDLGSGGIDLGEIVGYRMGDGLGVIRFIPYMLILRQLRNREVEALEEDPFRVRGGGQELIHPVVVAASVFDHEIRLGDGLGVVDARFVFVRIDIGIRQDARHLDPIAADLLGDVSVEILRRHDPDFPRPRFHRGKQCLPK